MKTKLRVNRPTGPGLLDDLLREAVRRHAEAVQGAILDVVGYHLEQTGKYPSRVWRVDRSDGSAAFGVGDAPHGWTATVYDTSVLAGLEIDGVH